MKKIKLIMIACLAALSAMALMAFSGCSTTVILNRYLDMNQATLAYMLTSDGEFTMYNVSDTPEAWMDYNYSASTDSVGGRQWEDRANDIKRVVVMENVSSIGNYTFYGNSNLTELHIGPDVTDIGENAFANCLNLKTITIDPANTAFSTENGYLKQLSDNRIIRGTNVSEIVFDSTVSYIEPSAFAGLDNIKRVDMSQSSITEISSTAFINCTSLSEVVLPDTIVSIGDKAFANCTSLSNINIQECSSMETIGETTFFNCASLKSLTLPSSVSGIGILAFSQSGIETVTLMQSDVNISIGGNAFYECNSLKDVYVSNSTIASRSSNSNALGYLLSTRYASSTGTINRKMNVYIAASCYDADNLGNYLKDTTVYTKADENVTVDGVEYVLYQAV